MGGTLDGYDRPRPEQSQRELPAIIAPGPLWKWFVLQELKLERKVFAHDHDPKHFSAFWRMSLGRKIETADTDISADTIGLTPQDEVAVRQALEKYFSRHNFKVKRVIFDALDHSTGTIGSYRTWDIRVEVS